ncbi:carbonic anhydrase 1 isoform X2 [Nematostella vectensis]|uniref:carbonic anhydrase 1 isoform X2 n=1 Tax=Nematostella vectensis TaxID=45351 RepID=UPI002076D7A6|nr:carbonic anhydrase 1 isoform X2 [Nematostella vectensis]
MATVFGGKWSYIDGENALGPLRWHKCYIGAEPGHQSPIDIVTKDVTQDSSLGSLWNTYEPVANSTLTNDGRTLQLTFANNNNVLSGGPLTDEYQLAMIKFHWAATEESAGSEHMIDSQGHAIEVQLVHWNKTKYRNIGEAITGEQGICILAVFFQVGNEANEGLDVIVDLLSKDEHKGCFSTEVKAAIDPKIFFPESEYWTYEGSLTTPPLTENVTWVICQSSLILSEDQMNVFRNIRNSHGDLMAKNSRPVCPINGRTIRSSDTLNNKHNDQ